MANDQTLLDNLIEDLPDTISQLDISISNIGDQIEFLENDKTAVERSMTIMTSAASGWMDEKAAELSPAASAITSGSWGIDNLTDWAIVSAGLKSIYGSDQVTSGAPSAAETKQYNRQIDFPLAYDHINHSLGTDGTYGLNVKISNLEAAESLQESNRAAFKGFLKAYDRNNI